MLTAVGDATNSRGREPQVQQPSALAAGTIAGTLP